MAGCSLRLSLIPETRAFLDPAAICGYTDAAALDGLKRMRFDIRTGRTLAVLLIAALALSACTSRTIPPLTFGRGKEVARTTPNLNVRLAFAPVTGVPSEPIARLNAAIREEAAKRSIIVVQSGDPNTDYIVQGYLSAVGGPSGTVLVFVWDIADRNGQRVHRVSGQESSTKGAPDPWAAVDSETLHIVALRTVDAIAAWLSRA
jgi:hypothetical protein